MALIKCIECNKEISDKAKFCVGCGCPLETKLDLMGPLIKLDKFEIATKDLEKKMNWYSAIKECDILGDGWRLPNIQELNQMYQNREKIGGLKDESYMSSTSSNNDFKYIQIFAFDLGFDFGNGKEYAAYIRLVRTIK